MRPVSNRRISREILINIINVSAFERRRGEGEAWRGSFSPSSLRSRPSSSLAFPSRASFALDEGENSPPPAPPIIVNHRFPITLPRLFTLTLSLSLSLSLSLLSFLHLFPRRTRQGEAKFQVAITRVRNLTFDVSVEFLTRRRSTDDTAPHCVTALYGIDGEKSVSSSRVSVFYLTGRQAGRGDPR